MPNYTISNDEMSEVIGSDINEVKCKEKNIMKLNGLAIENTFVEAFNMKASRIIVTADNTKWLEMQLCHLLDLQHLL